MKNIDRFKNIVEEYKAAYYECNNKKVVNIEYKNGFVYFTTGNVYQTTEKHRISQFEKITETLKKRSKTLKQTSS